MTDTRETANDRIRAIHGDSREVLKTLADCSVDSCVCDPPYALTSIVKRFGAGVPSHTKTARDIAARSTPIARLASGFMGQKWDTGETAHACPVEGRWPANCIHDGSEEVVGAFPVVGDSRPPWNQGSVRTNRIYGVDNKPRKLHNGFANRGSAARFFYAAKADSADRIGSNHATVKPIDLMQYLIRLVTPKGGLVLDPFAGTGTTGEAAWREGMRALLIEREAPYFADIERRIKLLSAGPDERARESIKASWRVADAPAV